MTSALYSPSEGQEGKTPQSREGCRRELAFLKQKAKKWRGLTTAEVTRLLSSIFTLLNPPSSRRATPKSNCNTRENAQRALGSNMGGHFYILGAATPIRRRPERKRWLHWPLTKVRLIFHFQVTGLFLRLTTLLKTARKSDNKQKISCLEALGRHAKSAKRRDSREKASSETWPQLQHRWGLGTQVEVPVLGGPADSELLASL